jgi:prephenate dehydrogenase
MGFIQLHLIPLKVDGVLPGPLGHLDLLYMSTQQTQAVAAVSHMPHWIAALFMQHIIQSEDSETKLQTAGTGFRDFTRVAQGSGEMWRDIFMANRSAMLDEIAAFRKVLDRAEQALEQNDEAWLMDMLEASAQARANWTGNQS